MVDEQLLPVFLGIELFLAQSEDKRFPLDCIFPDGNVLLDGIDLAISIGSG